MISLLSTIGLAVCVVAGGLVYETRLKVTDIGTEVSPGGNYKIDFQMVGKPFNTWSNTQVKIMVRRANNQKIETIEKSLVNDGWPLDSSNWDVSWNLDEVTITLTNANGADHVYVVSLTE